MTGGTNRSLEDLLREQLHEMDTVEPPDAGLRVPRAASRT